MVYSKKSVRLPTGITLPYVEQGSLDGLPVILLHGVSDSWRSFEQVLPHLPETIHAFAVTQRGHGDASRPLSGYRFHDFAADLPAFMDALGIETSVIVGHSMGASVAQRFAIDHSKRLRGLMLAGTFASYRNRPDLTDLWESTVSKLTDPVDPEFVREFQESTLAQPIPREVLEIAIQESLKLPAHVWKEAFQAFLEVDHSPDLGKIATPTLIVWGDQDGFCSRRDQDTLFYGIAGSRLIVYPGVGHAVHWEQPERFAKDLAAFVSGLHN